MPHHDVVLGIDVGTTNLKCLALDDAGTIVAQGSEPTPRAHPRPGWPDFETPPPWGGNRARDPGRCLATGAPRSRERNCRLKPRGVGRPNRFARSTPGAC